MSVSQIKEEGSRVAEGGAEVKGVAFCRVTLSTSVKSSLSGRRNTEKQTSWEGKIELTSTHIFSQVRNGSSGFKTSNSGQLEVEAVNSVTEVGVSAPTMLSERVCTPKSNIIQMVVVECHLHN